MTSILLLTIILLMAFLFARKRRANKILAVLVLVFFNLLVLEVFSYGYLIYRIRQGCNFYMIGNQFLLDQLIKINLLSRIHSEGDSSQVSFEIDNDLGYQPRPNKLSYQYQATNIQRMRADHAYTLIPPKDKLRIETFGDSFVYGDGELTQNTWPYILEQNVGNLEALNFGVSGYGLVQSYQRFVNYGVRYNPDIVFFNYVEATDRDQTSAVSILGGRELVNADLYRVNVEFKGDFLFFKAYNALDLFDDKFCERFIYAPVGLSAKSMPFSNKFFSVSNVGVVLKQWLAPRVMANRNLTQKPLDPKINARIIRNILRIAEFQQMKVIFFYAKDFRELPKEIQELFKQYSAQVIYVNSKTSLGKLFAFNNVKEETLFNETKHYNHRGNMIYAQAVKLILESQSWGRRDRVFKLDSATTSFVHLEDFKAASGKEK